MEFRTRLAVVDRLWKTLRETCDSQDPPDSALEALIELLAPLSLEEQVDLVEFGRQVVLSSAPLLDIFFLMVKKATAVEDMGPLSPWWLSERG